MNLSEHFTLAEFMRSDWAKRNGVETVPPAGDEEEIIANLTRTAFGMEQVRHALGDLPIRVTSGYRNPAVNVGAGGDPHSAHMTGFACDFECPLFGTDYEVAKAIRDARIDYDKLILEYGWIHIAFVGYGRIARHISLTKKSASTPYLPGLVP